MARWDYYVDETLSYLKSEYDLKFYNKNNHKYSVMMQFVDLLSIHEETYKFSSPRLPLAALFYLFIGGKDLMCAFQQDYKDLSELGNPLKL